MFYLHPSQGPASDLVKRHGPGSLWHEQAWFKLLWFAAENQGDSKDQVHSMEDIKLGSAMGYKKRLLSKVAHLDDSLHLAWALIMLRNVLGHVEVRKGDDSMGMPQGGSWQRMQLFISSTPFANPVVSVVDR